MILQYARQFPVVEGMGTENTSGKPNKLRCMMPITLLCAEILDTYWGVSNIFSVIQQAVL